MQQRFERDYRFLLDKLIPRQFLSNERIEGISAAISSGRRAEMIREAWLAMEELVSRSVFDRDDPRRSDGAVQITYSARTGRSRITLEMREEEWRAVKGTAERAAEIVPSILAGIISALSLNDSPADVSVKIESVLALAGHVEGGASAHLVLFREFEIPSIREGNRIAGTSLAEEKTGGFYGSALAAGDPHVLIGRDRFAAGAGLFAPGPRTGSIILLPLRSGGHVYGMMEVHSPSEDAPAPDRLTNYYMLSHGVLRLLDNNRHLERMVSVDRLTGVNNRNYYETQLPLEMERATRNRKCLAFLMIDIDDFKIFNDRYGHDVGDRVLRLVAQTIRLHLRKIDHLFRYGGEEFIVLLPGAGREPAERTAERIREVVAETRLELDEGRYLGITITIGGCIYPVDAADELDLFRKADQAMIRAKREGKNRVSFIGE
ncbi:MAG: GGDEF domain-containing protein [Candidatus Krumholzibacteria bacterium]|nr:GGDEF domain-containing protein [Candidatus Krumholzibacteria bacterium]